MCTLLDESLYPPFKKTHDSPITRGELAVHLPGHTLGPPPNDKNVYLCRFSTSPMLKLSGFQVKGFL